MINTGFFKDKTGEHLASAFTAVNGRNSPPSPPPRPNASHAMTTITHPRPVSRHSPDHPQELKSRMPARDKWSPPRPTVPANQQNGHHNGHQNGNQNGNQKGNSSNSPTLSHPDTPPLSPGKRKRSTSTEGDRSPPSPNGVLNQRRRLDSHVPIGRSDSPNTIAQVQQLVMEHPQARTLPPSDRIDNERSWAPYNGYPEPHPQHRDLLRTTDSDLLQNSVSPAQISVVDAQNGLERSSTTEITKAGVQVDHKKRKRVSATRQFQDVSDRNSNLPTEPRPAVGHAGGARRNVTKRSLNVRLLLHRR